MGTGSNNFASGSLEVMMSGASLYHPLIPRPVNSVRGRNCTIYWMLIHRLYSLLENLTSALQGITTFLALSLSLQKAISSFCQTSCFIMVENMLSVCVCVCVCVCMCVRSDMSDSWRPHGV